MEIDMLYIILCLLVMIGANTLNRSWALWLIGSIVFSPVVAGIFLMLVGEKE